MVTLTEDFGGTNQASTSWDYNGPGWVNWMKDNEQNQTSYVYDGAGRVTQVVYPDLGDVDFTYYPAGGVYTRTDQKQVVTTYTRDDLHRMTARGYSTGGSDSFAYDKSGRLTQASNSLVQVGLDYDGMGRLDSETHTFAGTATPYAVDFAYNMGPGAWTQTTTYPGGRSVTRSYDERFRIDGVDGRTNVGADWSYDLADRRTGAALGNGIASLFEYDDNGRMTHLKHAVSGNPIYELGYGYDAVGNRVYKEDLVNSTRSEFYEYDNRDRLRRFKRGTLAPTKDSITEVAHATLPSRHDWSDSTFMDSRGNWLQCTRILNGQETREARTVNGVNEYTSIDLNSLASPPDPVVPGYDDNGNLTADPTAPNAGGQAAGQTYTYDVENRLTQVTRTADSQVLLEIRYDGIGRRVESVEHIDPADGQAYSVAQVTRHIHAGLTPLVDYNVSSDGVGGHLNTRLREFIWGDRFPEPVALIDWTAAGDVGSGTAEVLHYVHDALGSVVGLTNAAGALVERYTYDPYGQTHIEDPATQTFRGWSRFGNPWSWTGQRFDATTGLYHFLFRGYSPRLGRWLQRDPAGYVDSVSLVEYVRSSPTFASDFLGLWTGRVHNKIIDSLDVPDSTKEALKRAGASQDSVLFPTPNYQHAMRDPDQSEADAKRLASEWFSRLEGEVVQAYQDQGYWTANDLHKIGQMLHFLMDQECPAHNWEVWHGFRHPKKAWKHRQAENWIGRNEMLRIVSILNDFLMRLFMLAVGEPLPPNLSDFEPVHGGAQEEEPSPVAPVPPPAWWYDPTGGSNFDICAPLRG